MGGADGSPRRMVWRGAKPEAPRALRDAQASREQRRAIATHVVAVHRLGEHDVGVGVEAAGELAGVVVEVALDGEPAAELTTASVRVQDG